MGVSEIRVPYFGVLIIRILLFRVLYQGPLFSETPIYTTNIGTLQACFCQSSEFGALLSETEA